MGKPTGFLDYEREDARAESPTIRCRSRRIRSRHRRQHDLHDQRPHERRLRFSEGGFFETYKRYFISF